MNLTSGTQFGFGDSKYMMKSQGFKSKKKKNNIHYLVPDKEKEPTIKEMIDEFLADG